MERLASPMVKLGQFSQLAYFVDGHNRPSIYSSPMQDTIQRQILSALLVTLKPLARALLRAGVGYREFEEISKAAFVEVATTDYGLRGRPTNVSRVAVMTGLTRKEVRRLRDKHEAGEESIVGKNAPMSVVLHRWYTENDYLGANGIPKILPFDGDEFSFSELVRKYGGDIPPGAMRTELKRIEAVIEDKNGNLTAVKRNVSRLGVHERLIDGLSIVIYPALLALANNTDADKADATWIMRTAATSRIRRSDASRVRRISSDRLTEFAESVDDLFAAYETLHDDDELESGDHSIGIGVFYFEEDKDSSHFYDRA